MIKLRKGYTYLVNVNNAFFIVQQVSMKGWVATNFTTANIGYEDKDIPISISGNSLRIIEELNGYLQVGNELEYRKYSDSKVMRKDMFNILKIGQLG